MMELKTPRDFRGLAGTIDDSNKFIQAYDQFSNSYTSMNLGVGKHGFPARTF